MHNWIDRLGFKCSARKKTYYVNGHERPDNVQYRTEYLKMYFYYEIRCFFWIQLLVVEVLLGIVMDCRDRWQHDVRSVCAYTFLQYGYVCILQCFNLHPETISIMTG